MALPRGSGYGLLVLLLLLACGSPQGPALQAIVPDNWYFEAAIPTATPEPTPIPTEAVTPAPEPTRSAPAAPVLDVASLFVQGYRDAGGPPELEAHFLERVIPCESGWDTYAVSPYGHRGLAQFARDSWVKAGGGDWRDAYQQGANVARWVMLTEPATQWACW